VHDRRRPVRHARSSVWKFDKTKVETGAREPWKLTVTASARRSTSAGR
jgi:hypothetical protein